MPPNWSATDTAPAGQRGQSNLQLLNNNSEVLPLLPKNSSFWRFCKKYVHQVVRIESKLLVHRKVLVFEKYLKSDWSLFCWVIRDPFSPTALTICCKVQIVPSWFYYMVGYGPVDKAHARGGQNSVIIWNEPPTGWLSVRSRPPNRACIIINRYFWWHLLRFRLVLLDSSVVTARWRKYPAGSSGVNWFVFGRNWPRENQR